MKAFPHKVYLETTDPTVQNPVVHGGMDLRDYFAAKAMQGLLTTVKDEQWDFIEVASISYLMANDMMKARKE